MDEIDITDAAAAAADSTATPSQVADAAAETMVDEELLVEEISIDGMCGVY